jgi:GGDEF domain-containing protein
MDFLTGAFATWLVERLADAGTKRLVVFVLGDEQERALRSTADVAVRLTAADFQPPSDSKQAKALAMIIDQVFRKPVPTKLPVGHTTFLEALQAEVELQVMVLGDANLTGTGKSSAELLGLSPTVLSERLTSHLVREIVNRGARGGPLAALANQIGHDVTHLEIKQLDQRLADLVGIVEGGFASQKRLTKPKVLVGGSAKNETGEIAGKDKEHGTRFIEDELPEIVSRAVSEGVKPAVVFIDIDDLTIINKRFGFHVGNSVLDATYEILQGRTLGKVKYQGRCGDDTFYSVLFDARRVKEYCIKLRTDVQSYPWKRICS